VDVIESTLRALPVPHARSHIFQGNPTGDVISGQKAPLGRILCNFLLCMHTPLPPPSGILRSLQGDVWMDISQLPRESPSGDVWWRHFQWKGPTRADIAQLPVAHAHPFHSFRVTWHSWPSITSGSHGTCTTVLHFVLLLVVQNVPLCMHMRSLPVLWRASSGYVTSGNVTSGHVNYVTFGQGRSRDFR
jgi:hypothetical protein